MIENSDNDTARSGPRSDAAAAPSAAAESDAVFLSAIIIGAVLVVAVVTQADPLLALLVGGGALIPLSVHLRRKQAHADWLAQTAVRPDTPQQKRAAIADTIDALPQATLVLGEGGIVLHANAQAKEMLGVREEGRLLSTYVRDSGLRARLEDAFAGKTPQPLDVNRIGETDQHLQILLSKAHYPTGPSLRDAFVYAVLTDVTRTRREDEQRADFLANASHELKTPLASLLGYIETLRGPARDDAEARDTFLGIMQSQAERMERLIRDLLSLRRIELSEHITPDAEADLVHAISAAQEIVAPLAKRRNVTLRIEAAAPEADIIGNPDECVQLVLNLLENAVKLSAEGETVSIRLEPLERFTGESLFGRPTALSGKAVRRIVPLMPGDTPVWRLTILDAGPGFSRAHLPRIGERFYRVAGDLSSREKGTGLGLAIVKHIAKRHRAGLFVRSEPDVGTEFSVVFPAAPE